MGEAVGAERGGEGRVDGESSRADHSVGHSPETGRGTLDRRRPPENTCNR